MRPQSRHHLLHRPLPVSTATAQKGMLNLAPVNYVHHVYHDLQNDIKAAHNSHVGALATAKVATSRAPVRCETENQATRALEAVLYRYTHSYSLSKQLT